MKASVTFMVCALGVAGCSNSNDPAHNNDSMAAATPATEPADSGSMSSATTQPDNTAINARDRSPDAVTPTMQGENQSDIDLTAEIRRRIVEQKMSVNAENVKIISQNGKVTLRGPVANQSEKDSIGDIANTVAGMANVDNQLEVQQ